MTFTAVIIINARIATMIAGAAQFAERRTPTLADAALETPEFVLPMAERAGFERWTAVLDIAPGAMGCGCQAC